MYYLLDWCIPDINRCTQQAKDEKDSDKSIQDSITGKRSETQNAEKELTDETQNIDDTLGEIDTSVDDDLLNSETELI